MASGPFIGYCLFSLVPMLISLYISFTELHGFNIFDAEWLGFDNYVHVLKSEMLYTSIVNTLLFCLSVPINMVVSLFLANMLNKPVAGTRFVRTVLFIPTVCSSVAVTLVWQWILDPKYGVINTVLQAMGLPAIGFTSTAEWFIPSVLLICLWQRGTNIVLMQSALSNVDNTLKEAARIDGATDMRVFYSVVLPGITPTLFYVLIVQMTAALQEIGMLQIISQNGIGPGYRAVTLSYYMYRMAFVNYGSEGMGMSCSLSWIVAVVIIILTRLNFVLSKKWVSYD